MNTPSILRTAFLGAMTLFGALHAQTPWNPAAGIYILQIGDIFPGDSTSATLFYTRYAGTDRVKSVDYYYNGYGFFELKNKRMISATPGADGIIHHPDGDLLIGGQSRWIYKVNKQTGNYTSISDVDARSNNFHLMMDPDNVTMWSADIPGVLARWPLYDSLPNRIGDGQVVTLQGDDRVLTNLAWDENGTVFYTRSDYRGTGSFGVIDMGTLTTRRIYANLPGTHGMHYDHYSKTIFIFGNAHIIQIDPVSKAILADLDFSKMGFGNIEWRFDQGTADGKGHLYVASNFGYLVFIDYTSNPNRRIDNNILIHVQWLDPELDDVAPLSGAGSENHRVTTSSGSGYSSSSRVFSSSSWTPSSSGTSSTGTGTSSTGTGTSSTGTGTSSTGTGTSSTGTGTSSSSDGTGGGGTPLSSSSSSDGTGGGGTPLSSSSSSDGTGGGGTPLSSSSSSDGTGGGGTPLSSSSSSDGTGGGGTPLSSSSSSDGSGGSGIPLPNLRDSTYTGFDGVPIPGDTNLYTYPDRDSRGAADSSVTSGTLLVPVPPSTPVGGNVILVGGNKYRTTSTGGDPVVGIGPSNPEEMAPVPTGTLVALTLDAVKLREYFGLEPGDSLRITATPGMSLVNPETGEGPANGVTLVLDGNTARIWVSSDVPLVDGNLYFTSESGKQLRYGGMQFYDPVPSTQAAIIKDRDGDGERDAVELFLGGSLPTGTTVIGADLVIGGTVRTVGSGISVTGDRVTIPVGSADRALLNQINDGDKIVVRYQDERGVVHQREVPLTAMNTRVIRRAVVLRSSTGADSLFVEFNIDITNQDLAMKDLLVLLNNSPVTASTAGLPARSLVLLESGNLALRSNGGDSLQLYPGVTFSVLQYIVSEEYDRKVAVEIVDRVPPVIAGSGYYDRNGDGVMDSVVIRFGDTITAEQLEWMYFSIPWYSYRNRIIQLQPQPGELVIHPDDPTMVTWIVRSNTELRTGLTHLPEDLPVAELYVHYPILDRSFVERQSFRMSDYMAPAIVDGRLHYSEDGRDTLVVRFSEIVQTDGLNIQSLFLYIHGSDTLPLHPSRIVWNADRTEATLLLSAGSEDRITAGDRLLVNGYSSTPIRDLGGNPVSTAAAPIIVQGALSHLVESSTMGSYSGSDSELRELSAVSLRLVPNSTRSRDLREKGELGHMVELGQRFLPQLVDQAQSSNGNDDLDPSKILISLSATYFDHIGQHVADTTITLSCDHAVFGGNCLESDDKLFLNWNYKSNDGRLVGTGVYLVQFKLYIRYERAQVMEEMMDKWGVRRRK